MVYLDSIFCIFINLGDIDSINSVKRLPPHGDQTSHLVAWEQEENFSGRYFYRNNCLWVSVLQEGLKLDLPSKGTSPDLHGRLIQTCQIQWSELEIWTWDTPLTSVWLLQLQKVTGCWQSSPWSCRTTQFPCSPCPPGWSSDFRLRTLGFELGTTDSGF